MVHQGALTQGAAHLALFSAKLAARRIAGNGLLEE